MKERGGGKERGSLPTHTNQGWARLKPGALSTSPCEWQGPKYSGRLLLLCPGYRQGAGLEVEQPAHKPEQHPYGMLVLQVQALYTIKQGWAQNIIWKARSRIDKVSHIGGKDTCSHVSMAWLVLKPALPLGCKCQSGSLTNHAITPFPNHLFLLVICYCPKNGLLMSLTRFSVG